MGDVIFFLHKVYPDSFKGADDLKLSTFKRVISLIRSRFKVVPLMELLYEKSPYRRASITFDDGYVDNWVYAYPLLKREGLKAHIFISTGRILKEGVRPNLFSYWEGKVKKDELPTPKRMGESHLEFIRKGLCEDYLSWEELSLMKDVFSFGSHGINHFSFPYSDEILDFYDGSNFHWTMLLYSGEPFIGLPKFPTKSELSIRKFFPSKEVISFCRSFKKEGNWKVRLINELKRNFKNLGEFEPFDKAKERVNYELRRSKEVIERELDVEVETFAWPFGQYSNWSKEIASSLYKFIFTIKKGLIDESSLNYELPRVSIGKDIFTALGRVLTFSSGLGLSVYKLFKGDKLL